jgi:hypothetical protein
VTIATECAHCAKPIRITVDSDLKYSIDDEGEPPLVFEPHVDWETFTESNIIRAY